ncbi:hypothetical protein Slin15195_G112620 [Septoria linicola]|uniref:Acyltransferase 3 domain-containing protein n=1 Tax=Septoria linicola TaxID=215465 RepID=A0A9Q9B5N6_9PEZI|nr:hypothetical protein Slin15195_G112620 [Septoria linicola]
MVMWTIPIELKGSFLVFCSLAFLTLVLRPGAGQRHAAIVAASLVCIAGILLQMCWKWSMACFLLGIVLAMFDAWPMDEGWWQALPQDAQKTANHGIFFLGWYLLCQPANTGNMSYSAETPGWKWLTSAIPSGYSADNYYRYWQSWGAFLFVYGILRISWLQQSLSRRPLLFLGEVSFMLYLVHLPMISILGFRLGNLILVLLV